MSAADRPEIVPDPFSEKLAGLRPIAPASTAMRCSFNWVGHQLCRYWAILAGALAISQSATLLFFLARPYPPILPPPATEPRYEQSLPEIAPTAPEFSPTPRQWSYRKALLTGDLNDLPIEEPTGDTIVSGKVLSVMSIFAE